MIGSLIFWALYLLIPLVLFYNFYFKRRNFPPGPVPLPLIGNLWSFVFEPPGDTLHVKWKKRYGPIYTMWFGEIPVICIADYSKIIATFQKDAETYAGRFSFKEMDRLMKGGNIGVIFTEGDLWKDQRRFALHVLRDFGLGKNLMQERILTEVETIMEKVDKDIEKKVTEHDLVAHIDIAVGSIIHSLVFGYRFHGEKEHEFKELKEKCHVFVKTGALLIAQIINLKPHIFKDLPVFRGYFKQIVGAAHDFLRFFEERIEEHKQVFDENEPALDYVGAFLKEKARRDKIGEPHGYTTSQLKGMAFDLWLAGQETTSTTLAWGVVYMIVNPKAQERLHQELDEVIGSNRLVTVADKPHLPYTCAVVNEFQRMCNLVPNNVLHRTTRDVQVDGYSFPKGTIIVPQVSAVLYDDQNFENPHLFDPTRFLDEKGQPKRCDELIPFSIGKRQCLGEGLARMELFLFTANIFNQYLITAGEVPPSLERTTGGTVQCPRFTCRIKKRHI